MPLNNDRFLNRSIYLSRDNCRFWAEDELRMYYIDVTRLERDFVDSILRRNPVFLHSTGAADKNGLQVYSADRIQHSYRFGFVRWDDKNLAWVAAWRGGKTEPLGPIIKEVEVLGHYFDKPKHLRNRW